MWNLKYRTLNILIEIKVKKMERMDLKHRQSDRLFEILQQFDDSGVSWP